MDVIDVVLGLVLGFAAGFIVREMISRRRGLKAQQMRRMGLDPSNGNNWRV